MDVDLHNLPVFRVYDFDYDSWFERIQPNGVFLNAEQRYDVIQVIDEFKDLNIEGLNLIFNGLKESEGKDSEYYTIEKGILNCWLFTTQTTVDCLIASKYFLIADSDYDRRYMRGKMKIILNEGFKKLYGFTKTSQADSLWRSLSCILNHFSEDLRNQYLKLTSLLDEQANMSSWWKDERDAETHLDAFLIYESRQKPLDESKVMIESLQLVRVLDAVNHFLQNLHACMTNWLNNQYRQYPELFSEE